MSAQSSFVSVPSATRLTAAVSGFLMQAIGARYEATPTVAADGQYQSIRIGSDGTVIVSDAALLAALGSIDFATETTLAALAGTDFATETTLVALAGTDFATQTTLAALLAAFAAEDFATQTTLAALLAAFSAEDFATETTLAALAGTDFATETTLTALFDWFDSGTGDLATETTLGVVRDNTDYANTQLTNIAAWDQIRERQLNSLLFLNSTKVSVSHTVDSTTALNIISGYPIAQQFLVPAGGMKVKSLVTRIDSNSNGSQTGQIYFEIRGQASGDIPDSTVVLARSNTFDVKQMKVAATIHTVQFDFRDCPLLVAGEKYWLCAVYSSISDGTGGSWGWKGGGSYTDGILKYEGPPSTWSVPGSDIYFIVNGYTDVLDTVPVSLGVAAAVGVKQAAITVGTSAVRLTHDGSAPSSGRRHLSFMPDPSSSANFWYGSSGVTSSGATRGIPVFPGQSVDKELPGAQEFYIISDTAGQTVFVVEEEA